jgi:hypothetical protein
MRAQNWTDIMTLLAVMVASGKMDKAAELTIFRNAAINLRDVFAPNIKLTDSFASDWLAVNQADITRKATSVHFESSVKALQKNLDGLANKNEILITIMKWTMTEVPNGTRNQLRFKAEPEDMLSAA